VQVWSIVGTYLGQHVGHTDAVACLTLDANFLFSGEATSTLIRINWKLMLNTLFSEGSALSHSSVLSFTG